MRKARFHFELFRWVGIVAPIVTVAGKAAYDNYIHSFQHHTGFTGSGANKVLAICGCNVAWNILGIIVIACLGLASVYLAFRFIGLVVTVYDNLQVQAKQSERFDRISKKFSK